MRNSVANGILLVLATVLSLGCIEFALRSLYPGAALGSGKDLDWFRTPGTEVATTMVPDGEIGFRPRLNGEKYDAHGIRRQPGPLPDAGGVRRILFIGDSVTARGRILDALRLELDDPTAVFLNGGIESFNLVQEVNFFLRFQSDLPVDRIIHQVHGNDLQATAIAFRDDTGTLNAYSLSVPKQWVNEWLFRHSYVYRLALAATLARQGAETTFDEARDNFRTMAAFAARRGIRYDVVLFPVLFADHQLSAAERRDWLILERACHDAVRHCISLLPVLHRMVAEGRPVQEVPGDMWHPNDEFAAEAAKYIVHALAGHDVASSYEEAMTAGATIRE